MILSYLNLTCWHIPYYSIPEYVFDIFICRIVQFFVWDVSIRSKKKVIKIILLPFTWCGLDSILHRTIIKNNIKILQTSKRGTTIMILLCFFPIKRRKHLNRVFVCNYRKRQINKVPLGDRVTGDIVTRINGSHLQFILISSYLFWRRS